MKKTGTVILICLLFIAAAMPAGFSVIFLVKQQIIRHQMLEKMEVTILQTIRVSASEIRWIKKDKEILYNGKMFDVKTLRLENEQYIIHGLYDDDETSLNRLLDNELSHRNSNGNRLLTHFFLWLQTSMPGNDFPILDTPSYPKHQIFTFTPTLSIGFITIPFSPPRC